MKVHRTRVHGTVRHLVESIQVSHITNYSQIHQDGLRLF